MSNFKLEFTLKQHTPMIHFQHDQAGATLRATELKPKLDKFIIEKMRGWEKIPTAWRVGKTKNQHPALDYKVAILPVKPKIYEIRKGEKIPSFFANMGDDYKDEKIKSFSYSDEKIYIEIICFDTSLRSTIESCFSIFLSQTNFGTRQSKGFGSFFLDPEDHPDNVLPGLSFSFEVTVSRDKAWHEQAKELFFPIDLFYRALRSGINIPGGAKHSIVENHKGEEEVHLERSTEFYCKAILFHYLRNQKLQWDKKSVKEAYFNAFPDVRRKATKKEREDFGVDFVFEKGLSKQKNHWQSSDILHFPDSEPKGTVKKGFLFRDLFGLSTEETWHSYGATIQKKHKILNAKTNQWEVASEKDPNRIVRFKSPIIFKPIKLNDTTFQVWFDVIEPPEEFRNKTFFIECSRKPGSAKDLDLKIASKTEFTFGDFFKYIFQKKHLDLSTYIESRYHNFRDRDGFQYYRVLTDVFNQLQK